MATATDASLKMFYACLLGEALSKASSGSVEEVVEDVPRSFPCLACGNSCGSNRARVTEVAAKPSQGQVLPEPLKLCIPCVVILRERTKQRWRPEHPRAYRMATAFCKEYPVLTGQRVQWKCVVCSKVGRTGNFNAALMTCKSCIPKTELALERL